MLPRTDLLDLLRGRSRSLDNARAGIAGHAEALAERRELSLLLGSVAGLDTWVRLGPRRAVPPHGVHVGGDAGSGAGEGTRASQVSGFVLEGLSRGERVVVIATPAHRAALRRRVELSGFRRDAEELLVEVDAAELLVALRTGSGRVDARRLSVAVHALLGGPPGGIAPTRVAGDVGDLLVEEGDLASAEHLERVVTRVQRQYGVPLLCTYCTRDPKVQHAVLALHTHQAGATAA